MKKYCLDTGIFIEPWNKYYSPQFTKGYWDILRIKKIAIRMLNENFHIKTISEITKLSKSEIEKLKKN